MWRWRDWVIDAFNAQPAVRPVHHRAARRRPAARTRRSSRRSRPASTATTASRSRAASSRRSTASSTSSTASRRRPRRGSGLTMGCARCHDHKYDPITQKEFYQFFAFFNNVPENGIDGRNFNSPPLIPAPVGDGGRSSSRTSTRTSPATEAAVASDRAGDRRGGRRSGNALSRTSRRRRRSRRGSIAHYPLDGNALDAVAPCRGGEFRDGDAKFEPRPARASRASSTASASSTSATSAASRRTTRSASARGSSRPTTTDAAFIARMDEKNEPTRLQPLLAARADPPPVHAQGRRTT